MKKFCFATCSLLILIFGIPQVLKAIDKDTNVIIAFMDADKKVYNTNNIHVFNFSLGAGIPGTAFWMTPTMPSGWFGRNSASPLTFNELENIPFYFKGSFSINYRHELGISANYSDFYYNEALYSFRVKSLAIQLRANRFRVLNDHFLVYFGTGVGYRFGYYMERFRGIPYNYESYLVKKTLEFPLSFESTIGLRYFIDDIFGFYIEAGYARSLLQTSFVFRPKSGSVK